MKTPNGTDRPSRHQKAQKNPSPSSPESEPSADSGIRTERIPEQPWRPRVDPSRKRRRFSSHQQPPRPRGTALENLKKTGRSRVSAARLGASAAGGKLWGRVKTADFPPALVLGAGAALLVVGVAATLLIGPATTRSAVNSQAQDGAVKSQVLALCSAGDQLATELQARGACDVAVKANQLPSAIDTGPTDAQVTRLIADYFTSHPNLYRPSVESVREAARAVLEGDPELYRGPLGHQGIPGPGPTDQQIAAAMAAYIAAHRADFQGAKGDAGAPGAAGRGIATGPRFRRDSAGGCESVVTYTDGTQDQAPAGDASCPGGSGGSGGGSPEPPGTTQPAPTTEQPSPTTDQTAPPAQTPPAPTTDGSPPPTEPGLLGGLLGG